jgi:hypothetical protein
MKAYIDNQTSGIRTVLGIKTQLVGRIKGSTRSRKLVKIKGNLGAQDVLRRYSMSFQPINTKYGTLGLTVSTSIARIGKTSITTNLIKCIS